MRLLEYNWHDKLLRKGGLDRGRLGKGNHISENGTNGEWELEQ